MKEIMTSGAGKFGVILVTYLGGYIEVTFKIIMLDLLQHICIYLFQVKSNQTVELISWATAIELCLSLFIAGCLTIVLPIVL